METEKVISNWDKLKYRVPLILEGFNPLYHEGKPVSPESHVQLQLNDNSYQQNYEIFKNRVLNNIGKNFLPIYRMADGEFSFVKEMRKLNLIDKILSKMGIRQFETCWGEEYNFNELVEIKKHYYKQLKRISEKSMLALHFIEFSNSNHPYSRLYKLATDIFDHERIFLSTNNFTSFYYVYALLTGPDRTLVLKNNKILIITSYDEQKKAGIAKFLEHEKASSVDFLNISPVKSMFEKIDLSKTDGPYDLVLIGAGIGSSNILTQCENLNTVCIDAGIVLERYADSTLSKSRIFLI